MFSVARRSIHRLLSWRRGHAIAAAKLAKDLGLPNDKVSDILDRTAADLRKLSSADEDGMDARPIINRAIRDLSTLGSPAFDDAILDQYLQKLPDRDYQILRYFKEGRKHHEIAELMGTNVELVRQSLVKTYADMRVAMLGTPAE